MRAQSHVIPCQTQGMARHLTKLVTGHPLYGDVDAWRIAEAGGERQRGTVEGIQLELVELLPDGTWNVVAAHQTKKNPLLPCSMRVCESW